MDCVKDDIMKGVNKVITGNKEMNGKRRHTAPTSNNGIWAGE